MMDSLDTYTSIFDDTVIDAGDIFPVYTEGSDDISPGMETEMTRFALKDETEEFANKVVALVVPKNAKGWKAKVEALWQDVQERGFTDKTDSTKKLYMSKFRKAVRDELEESEENEKRRTRVDEALMEIIRIDKEILTKLQEDYQTRVKAGNTDLFVVPQWEWVVKMAREMMKSADMELRAIGLMLVTGRRFREILQTAEFEPLVEETKRGDVRHRWLLVFKGQLKTKGGEGTMHDKAFPIPVLAPAKEVLKSFAELRASPAGRVWANAPERQLSTNDNPKFNKAVQTSPIAKYWPARAPLTLKELRALYAEIAYENFAPRTTRAPYYARVLGHGEEDLTTALSYMKYMLSEDALSEGQEEMNRLTMLREQRKEEAIAAKRGEQDGETDPNEVGSDDLIED